MSIAVAAEHFVIIYYPKIARREKCKSAVNIYTNKNALTEKLGQNTHSQCGECACECNTALSLR